MSYIACCFMDVMGRSCYTMHVMGWSCRVMSIVTCHWFLLMACGVGNMNVVRCSTPMIYMFYVRVQQV